MIETLGKTNNKPYSISLLLSTTDFTWITKALLYLSQSCNLSSPDFDDRAQSIISMVSYFDKSRRKVSIGIFEAFSGEGRTIRRRRRTSDQVGVSQNV